MIEQENSDLSTLASDLILEWNKKTILNEYVDVDYADRETLEDFLHTSLNPNAKAYIYERECPFMSKETLNAYFGDVAFIQHSASISPNTFNVRLIANCTESMIRFFVDRYNSGLGAKDSNSRIIRLGLLKNFFSEPFEPFHETMKRILAMKTTKEWMKNALDKSSNPKNSPEDLIFSFANGQLLTIL